MTDLGLKKGKERRYLVLAWVFGWPDSAGSRREPMPSGWEKTVAGGVGRAGYCLLAWLKDCSTAAVMRFQPYFCFSSRTPAVKASSLFSL